LPNGNLIVFVSNEARVFEVDAEDQIVWDFLGPWVTKQGRRPIRGERLTGPALSRVKDILAGTVDPPKKGIVAAPPDALEDTEGDAKADAKGDAKADAKGDAKADAKPDAKGDAKADGKSGKGTKATKGADGAKPDAKGKKPPGGEDDKAGPK
jgi:hypothetical protein